MKESHPIANSRVLHETIKIFDQGPILWSNDADINNQNWQVLRNCRKF